MDSNILIKKNLWAKGDILKKNKGVMKESYSMQKNAH